MINIFGLCTASMRVLQLLSASILVPITCLAAPSSHLNDGLNKRDNLCSLKAPPVLCTPNASVTVDETALRAYKFYRAFVVDGDPKTMFSLIDSTYKVNANLRLSSQHRYLPTLDKERAKPSTCSNIIQGTQTVQTPSGRCFAAGTR